MLSRSFIARARALAEQIDRPEYLVPLLYGQWAFHLMRAEHRLALPLAEQIEEIGEARKDVPVQLLGRRLHGMSRSYLGEFVASRALLEECRGLSDPAYRTGGATEDPYATMLGNLALMLAYLGYLDQAKARLDEALLEARRVGHTHTLVPRITDPRNRA